MALGKDEYNKIVLVIPFFNEGDNLKVLLEGLNSQEAIIHTILFVNDGSTDSSEEIIRKTAVNIAIPIEILRLSRNFGHQKAILAGLEVAYKKCGAEVYYGIMDADNEDKPEDLSILYNSLRHLKCSCVFAVRKSRQVSWFDSLSSKAYHALFKWLSTDIEVPSSGAFCIMAPKMVQEILKFQVYQPYFPGIRAWVGFGQQPVEIHRGKREFGASQVRLRGRVRLAFNSFLNHSNLALDLIQWGGLTIFGISVAASLVLAFLRVVNIVKISGFTSVLISIFMSTGLILMALGIMTHYLARIYYTISAYPRVVVDELVKIEKTSNNAPGSS